MTYRVFRFGVEQMAAGPATGVATSASGESPLERFRYLLPPDRIPANTELVWLWRGERLSSADTVAVTELNTIGPRIDVQIELRRFEGTLHANIVTVPVVEVDLGPLQPDTYEISTEVVKLRFREHGHPEEAGNVTTERTTFTFTVV